MGQLEKYIKQKKPSFIFSQLTAEEKKEIAESLSFSSWKTVQAAREVKELADEWAKTSRL